MTKTAATCQQTNRKCPAHRRNVAMRAQHLCRGRGDRRCRCHIAARPRLARLSLHDLPFVPLAEQSRPNVNGWLCIQRMQPPVSQPRRPQAPPFSVSEPLNIDFGTGKNHGPFL